jgi:hypothetical protein
MTLNGYQKASIGFFIALVVYWTVLFASGLKAGFYNDFFVFLYGLLPLFGGIAAIRGYREWGGLSTILGRAILFLGLGLFLWGAGETVWSYYNFFLHIETPYPSIADLFFAPSVFCYTLGTIYVARTTGARLGLRTLGGKAFAALAPVAVFVLAYYVLIVVGQGGHLLSQGSSLLKATLDIAYPLGDAVSLAVSLVVAGLSFRYMGGRYKSDILFILAGLAIMFAADSVLSYTSTIGTARSGDFGDLLFTAGIFFLTCGVLGFNKVKNVEVPVAD